MPYHSSPSPQPSRPPPVSAVPPSTAPSSPLSVGAVPVGGRTAAPVSAASIASNNNNNNNNTSINNANYNIDQTVRVFDSFFEYDVNVPAAEYDIVYSYFRREMTTALAAGNFTVSLFRVAEETGIPALDLLEQFRGENGVNLNVQLAYYLNSIRNKATLLGVGVPIQSNQYAARLIVQ